MRRLLQNAAKVITKYVTYYKMHCHYKNAAEHLRLAFSLTAKPACGRMLLKADISAREKPSILAALITYLTDL